MDGWLKKRVDKRLNELGLGPVEAATAAGMERTFIRDIIESKKVSVRTAGALQLSLALKAPKEYFLFEDYELPEAYELAGHYDDFDPNARAVVTAASDVVFIPEYDIRLAAGDGQLADAESIKDRWPFSRRFLSNEVKVSLDNLSIVEVVGNSMEPRLQSHDRIIIDHTDTNPTPPGVFALWDGYGLVVKNVQRVHRSEPQRLLLVSDNPVFPPYEVLVDEITIIGRVVWFSRRM